MRIRFYSAVLRSTAMLLVALSFGCGLRAQVTSAIQGRVTDPSGAIVAAASITVTNAATGVSRTVLAAPDGHYRVPDLLPGLYEVRVEHPGFRTLIQRGIDVRDEAVLNFDAGLEVGSTSQALEVTAAVPAVETTQSRISEVVTTSQIQSLPMIGRGLTWLAVMVPGVEGKAEDTRTGLCCDAFSSLASPNLSGSGNTRKAVFSVDGIALHYGDGFNWNLAFTPNPDAVEEMRVSTNPTSAESGIISGVQVQMVTKGGTNSFDGTAHLTDLESSFNAVPYGSSRENIGSWYQRYFGGTVGGPVIKNRLFFFAGYQGLRQQTAGASVFSSATSTYLVETEAFKNWLNSTRPNAVTTKILTENPPFRYPTENLVDVNKDGIPDLGTLVSDRPAKRTGDQYNGRVDYQSKNAKDRIYGSFWHNQADQPGADIRPTYDNDTKTSSILLSFVHTHTFTSNSLNEARFAFWDLKYDSELTHGTYNVPCVSTDDGLNIGSCTFGYEVFDSPVYDMGDTFSWTHGRHTVKVGGSYRHVYMTDPAYLTGDIPAYSFSSMLDFANDTPYRELRNIDAATGKLRDPFVEAMDKQLSFFVQNTWQVRPGLTLNYGLRWDDYFNFPVDGLTRKRETFAPLFTSSQVTPQGITAIVNQKTTKSFNSDLNNFGPRISVAWDPTNSGKTAIRGGFFVLYDETGSLGAYRSLYGNPPISSLVTAGPQYDIPVVYGIAPVGTRDFPVNPGLVGPAIDPQYGTFVGTRPNIFGFAQDYRAPMIYDANAAVERQIANNLTLSLTYHYQRTKEQFGFDANRYDGDLVDGRLDRLNPHYGAITTATNIGKRSYHGLIVAARKQFSHGWQANISYTYNNAWDNLGTTEVFNPAVDASRVESATHTLKLYAVWDLPLFRGRTRGLPGLIGGWQLSTIWNFESGPYLNPVTTAVYGSGGDFNADGQTGDCPDVPTSAISRSYSKQQWLDGALSASVFPLPTTVRDGTLPRNYLVGPGYERIDASLAKYFPIRERVRIQFQAQASNLLNRLNISGVSTSLNSASFGRATSFYPMRAVQFTVRALF